MEADQELDGDGWPRRRPWNKIDHDDGFHWTKYGHKALRSTERRMQRLYYRCSFPGCSAKKHVGATHTPHLPIVTLCDAVQSSLLKPLRTCARTLATMCMKQGHAGRV